MTRWTQLVVALFLAAICFQGWAVAPGRPQVSSLNNFPAGVPMPLRVGVGLYVIDLNQLDESAGTFQGHIELRFRWRDPALAFSASTTGSNFQAFADQEALDKLATLWSPKIVVSNLLTGDDTIVTGLILRADGTVELVQNITGTFETRLRLDAFPFDRQNLSVVLLSSLYSSNQVALVQEDSEVRTSGFDPEISLSGWRIENLNFKPEQVVTWSGLPAEQITANLRIERVASGILSTIFVPLLLLMLVPTIITLAPAFELPARLSSWAGSILALIALNFTLSLRFPGLGEGSLVGLAIVIGHIYQFVLVILTVTLFNPQFMLRMGDPFVVSELSDYLKWSVPVSFVGVLALETLLIAYSW